MSGLQMPSSFRFHFLWVVIAFNLSLQVVLSAEEFTLKDKATGTTQAVISASTGRVKLGEARYSLITKNAGSAFLLVGGEKDAARVYGPFAFSNGVECKVGGVTYVIEKAPIQIVRRPNDWVEKDQTVKGSVDIGKNLEINRKAADQGDPLAQYNLGCAYEYGDGVEKDMSKAVEWYGRAAKQGHVKAQANLSHCYSDEKWSGRDGAKAVEWARKAADQGDSHAEWFLGYYYRNGVGVERDLKKGAEWYRKSADHGYAGAQYMLSYCYASGEGVEKDEEKAFALIRKPAEQGEPASQNALGIYYFNGIGVQKDLVKAVEWFRKAADQGDSDGQNSLGLCYAQGIGVQTDLIKAAELFRKAADQGKPRAQQNLANCYQQGFGVEKDLAKASELLHKAADQGYEPAKIYLAELEPPLSIFNPSLKQSYETCCQSFGTAPLKPVKGNISTSWHKFDGYSVDVVYVNGRAECVTYSREDGKAFTDAEKAKIRQANSLGTRWAKAPFSGSDFWMLDSQENIMAPATSGAKYELFSSAGADAKIAQLNEQLRKGREYDALAPRRQVPEEDTETPPVVDWRRPAMTPQEAKERIDGKRWTAEDENDNKTSFYGTYAGVYPTVQEASAKAEKLNFLQEDQTQRMMEQVINGGIQQGGGNPAQGGKAGRWTYQYDEKANGFVVYKMGYGGGR